METSGPNCEPPTPTSEKSKSPPPDDKTVVKPTSKGVENAKKRLRAFSIQKKSSLSPVPTKPSICNTGSTVFIGKFSNAKQPLKPSAILEEAPDPKKPPKPPKPGTSRMLNADYLNLQKKTLSEIEDMKRKMELVELGIPLGLICPTPDSDKAMPTKAMPPIKSLLDPAKVDEIIREAKQAKAEGKPFKFSYQKLLPSYSNPFARKEKDKEPPPEERKDRTDDRQIRERSRFRRYSGHRDSRSRHDDDRAKRRANVIRSREDKVERKERQDKRRERMSKETKKERKPKEESKKIDTINLSDDDDVEEVKDVADKKETDVDLKEFIVCDSWSENEEKTKVNDSKEPTTPKQVDPMEQLKQELLSDSKEIEPVEKLMPVTDSFKFEIEDDDDEEILDMFDESIATDKFAKLVPKKELYDSPVPMRFDYDNKETMDAMDDTFLESVIAEIKQEEIDENTQDKGLVEYESPKDERVSITPELDDRIRELYSSRSDYSDTFKSEKSIESGYITTDSQKSVERHKYTESGYTSPEDYRDKGEKERGYKTTESGFKSPEMVRPDDVKMAKSTVDSLETWSFVLKICQPILFRHDKNKCYKETRGTPKVWFASNPKLCDCVKDRSVVYEELEMCKMALVDSVYGTHQMPEAVYPEARGWYPESFLEPSEAVALCSEWEAEDSQQSPGPAPHNSDEMLLDREYHKFMEAVWPEVDRSETPRVTPDPPDREKGEEPRKKKRAKLTSEGWSQDSEGEDPERQTKRQKVEKVKRKRKHSPALSESAEETPSKKKKKASKKDAKKSKSKPTKRLSKKYLKTLKEKQLKKKKKVILKKLEEESELEEEREKKKKDKKLKKKKPIKQKKKNQKKKKYKARSSSSSDSESDRKSKKTKKKSKKRKQSTSESNQSEELFDVNILKNIKAERMSDDEKKGFSPKKHREIINVKQLQNDFVSIQIKKEAEEVNSPEAFEETLEEEKIQKEEEVEEKEPEVCQPPVDLLEQKEEPEFKEPEHPRPPTPQPKPVPDESNLSQSSSQESVSSVKEQLYEKDDSHLRPSSQNSNYTFHDVIESEGLETLGQEEYEQDNYEMYEQLAMAYQSDVASQRVPPPDEAPSGRIETVVRARSRGEIKCDWRAGDPADTTPRRPSRWGDPAPASSAPTPAAQRVSRWGLKPSDVNIVLTGGGEIEHNEHNAPTEQYQIETVVAPTPAPAPAVYKIQSLANRTDNSNTGYDEAYMDMYGASDRLQYGDCFSRETTIKEVEKAPAVSKMSSLDDRINLALRETVLGDVAKNDAEVEESDKGILVTKSLAETRSVKRVSFADGYKPGQDSDTEEPPVRKRKKARREGCPWPCPATHPDHVSLWDALPPPPPPPGSPPPPRPLAPPLHLLRQGRPPIMQQHLHNMPKFDPASLAAFMPPEPPPGLIQF